VIIHLQPFLVFFLLKHHAGGDYLLLNRPMQGGDSMAGEFVPLHKMNLARYWINSILSRVVCFPFILFNLSYKFLSGLRTKSHKFGWDDSFFHGISMGFRNRVVTSFWKIVWENRERMIPGDHTTAKREYTMRRHGDQ